MHRPLSAFLATTALLAMPLAAQDERPTAEPRPTQPPHPGERSPFPPREGEGRGPRDEERPFRPGSPDGRRDGDRRGEPPERVSKRPTSYLGVVTNIAPAALATQFGLTEGFGLVVEEVVPGSPAQAAGLQRHDLLTLLDGQQLAAPGQLAALIRAAGKDKEVNLTLIRKTAALKVTVKVGETLLPERAHIEGGGGGMLPNTAPPFPSADRDSRDRTRPADLLRELRPGGDRAARDPSGEGVSRWDANRARLTLRDRDGELELTTRDGQRTLIAKNAQGETIFSGPVDTAAQRDALPAELRARLATLEAQKPDQPRRPQRPVPPDSPDGAGVQ